MKDLPFTEYFKKEQEEKVATKVLYRILFVMAAIFLIFFSVNYVFEQKYSYITISGRSMQSTLNPSPVYTSITTDGETTKAWLQDGVYIEETKNVDYNDIIVINNAAKDKTVIKRALAFGGDYISIVKLQLEDGASEYRFIRVKENTSIVEVLEEGYVNNHTAWAADLQLPQDVQTPTVVYEPVFYQTFSNNGYDAKLVTLPKFDLEIKMFKVPEDEVFYMGDNRLFSADAREKGTISNESVRGKVVEIVRNGSYYKGNDFYFFNRLGGYFRVIWKEILRFFGANV
ncbi:MAG: signal peptidase I [Clostridia bacterium]|nr:signal peptidase I [Clostridia bacterium]